MSSTLKLIENDFLVVKYIRNYRSNVTFFKVFMFLYLFNIIVDCTSCYDNLLKLDACIFTHILIHQLLLNGHFYSRIRLSLMKLLNRRIAYLHQTN